MRDDNNLSKNEMTEKAKRVSLSELSTESAKGGKPLDKNYSIVSDVKVNLEAFIGSANLTIKELFDLQMGSVVELNESIDTSLVLMLDGKPVASGALVVVGDNFGIKVTEIVKSNVTTTT